MIDMQNIKFHNFVVPLDINGTTATDTELDTAGYDYLTVIVTTGNVAANMTALKFQHSDTSGSGETDIPGASWSTLPLATGGDNTTRVGFIDLRKCKRYVSVVATAGAGATLIHIQGLLSRADVSPTDVTTRNITEQFFV